jgi:hypothetical protein
MIKKMNFQVLYQIRLILEYSFEYITALLMNLTLRSSGKKKCEKLKSKILIVLRDLMDHENI